MRRDSRTPRSLGNGVLADCSQRLNGDTSGARHIGRLGALAVALGIGTAGMALPGIAHADDAGAPGSGPDRSTAAKARPSERARGIRGRTGPAAAATTAPPSPRPAAARVTASPSGNLAAGPRNPVADLANRRQHNEPSGQSTDLLAGAALLVRRSMVDNVAPPAATVTAAGAEPAIRLAVFGDAGNSYTNGTSFYYSPGAYRRLDLGASSPLQQAVTEMMRGWNPNDVIQLGDESYNVASSSLLDYNIGQYYNNWIHPYAPPAFTQAGSIYTDGTLGGIQATPGKTQWPYNLYDFPNGFRNPADPALPGGSPDRVNHYFAVPGNHDEATVLGTYNDASVDQVNFGTGYIGQPIGPDAYDYQNNIIKNPPYPENGTLITSKTGSTQALLDYHSYLGAGNPGNLKPGSLNIGKLDPNGYGIYYGVDLGDAGDGRPLVHLTIVDTSRLLTDAGYYAFNFAPNPANQAIDPATGKPAAKLTKIFNYDVRDPDLTASDAWFQPADTPLDAPSIGREMFLWAKADLENSNAVWNLLMGHHPAYHAGSARNAADDSYSSNAVVLNFLQGLQDETGATLFDAYMNGHSHAYSRVLEMTASADGIGLGVPFFTIGDGGKSLDALNLAPYGTDVLSPINYGNFIGYDLNGKPLFNYDINKYGTVEDPKSEAASLAAYQGSDPTSVGLSGYYVYSNVNWPEGNGYVPGEDPSKLTITSVTTDPILGTRKTFDLKQPTYLSFLGDQADLSGLYGFGSGAAQLDVGDSYMMVHYQTAKPIDPAIALIGRSEGITDFGRETLFYKQWSPASAKADDLALFSFDVDADGALTNVQLVNSGNGYFESDLSGGVYLDVTRDFEILGNNPANPLGFSSSDPTRAVVRLSFSAGQLTGATLVNPGSDYQQVGNAIKQCNNCGPSTVATPQNPKNNSLLVGLNIDMEAQYTLAASHPSDGPSYHDWYLMTDTAVAGKQAAAAGSFGAVDLSLLPESAKAREFLADTPLTTGYTGRGPQRAYAAPQAGQLRLRDALGQLVGSAVVKDGSARVTLDRLAAPGALTVEFDGDATSSYQVNFRGIDPIDNVRLGLNYGTWSGTVAQQGSKLVLADTQTIQVMRTDSGRGLVNFGITNGTSSKTLARWAFGARQGALQADELFGTDPSTNWQSTEGRSEGGAGSATVGAGTWRPTAYQNGRELTLLSLQVEGNGALARFAAGNPEDPSDDVLATFTLPATGTTATDENGVLTVRRLSGMADGLALYEADPITGAVVDSKGRTRLPGQIGYLKAALDNAEQLGLVLSPEDMPGFGETAVRTDLPIQTGRNYGALLLVNGNERKLLSSYSAANPLRSQQSLSLIAPGRGVSFGFEDRRPWQLGSDRDFNDVIVTLTPAVPTLIA
jgi:hypothetical protein